MDGLYRNSKKLPLHGLISRFLRLGSAGSFRQGFEQAIMNMTQGVCLYDADDRLQLCNEQFCRIYNQPMSELYVGMRFCDMMAASAAKGNYPGRTGEEIWRERKAFIDQRQPGTFLQVLGDGRQIAISHQPLQDGGWVATYEDVTERRRAEAQIEFMAHHDALTKLPNRILFSERLEASVKASRTGLPCALLCLDLDGFKPVNDRLGHAAGDTLLQAVAGRLRMELRDTDFAARLGGDEFAMLLCDVTPAEAVMVANRVNASLCQVYHLGVHGPAQIGASIGVACAPEHATVPGALLQQADKALYAAKQAGLSIPRLYCGLLNNPSIKPERKGIARPEPAGLATLRAAAAMANDLRVALQAGHISLQYQPICAVDGLAPVAFEVTSRWCDPDRGVIPAEQFIPAAEESGFIVTLMEWVLRQACLEAAKWDPSLKIGVNLSPVNFSDPGLLSMVRTVLAQTGMPANRLIVELTEGLMLDNSDDVERTIAGLRDLGVEIWLDDFGTGYANFAYLQTLPFSAIKIDRSFLADRPQREAVLGGIIALGHVCGFQIIAEGVETQEHQDLLVKLGCDRLQGYLLGRPTASPFPATQMQTVPRP